MITTHKIYHLDTKAKDTVVTVKVVFEGSGNPAEDHKIIGVVVEEDETPVITIGREK